MRPQFPRVNLNAFGSLMIRTRSRMPNSDDLTFQLMWTIITAGKGQAINCVGSISVGCEQEGVERVNCSG